MSEGGISCYVGQSGVLNGQSNIPSEVKSPLTEFSTSVMGLLLN